MTENAKRPRPMERAWVGYRGMVDPIMEPLAKGISISMVSRLMGFFVSWHLFGGFEGLKSAGWSRVTIWKNRGQFEHAFGVQVEDAWPELAAAVVAMRRDDVG